MMTNPIVHMMVFIAAVVIPGGLLVYFAWRAYAKSAPANVEPPLPSPKEALNAFLSMYPKESPDTKAPRERVDIMRIAKTRPKSISQ
jgi:hypothetical protein